MVVTIVPCSARITFDLRPGAQAPVINPPTAPGTALFDSHPMGASGEVRLRGESGDSPAGWTLGFVQVQWIETNWVYYRGRQNDHGSLFLQRGRPPARSTQACRDTHRSPVNDIWYSPPDNGTTSGFSHELICSIYDKPVESCRLAERNSQTDTDNYLHECQLGFAFCTALVLRTPTGSFQQLAHFYWNVRWQARFEPTLGPAGPANWRITPNPGYRAGLSRVFMGAVRDPRFDAILTQPQTQNCQQMSDAARRRVEPGGAGRSERNRWTTFDVRR